MIWSSPIVNKNHPENYSYLVVRYLNTSLITKSHYISSCQVPIVGIIPISSTTASSCTCTECLTCKIGSNPSSHINRCIHKTPARGYRDLTSACGSIPSPWCHTPSACKIIAAPLIGTDDRAKLVVRSNTLENIEENSCWKPIEFDNSHMLDK